VLTLDFVDCGGAVLGSTNRIDWEIKFNGESSEQKTMSFDNCTNAFQIERRACDTGSEQEHHDFTWRIDPNAGPCPYAPPSPSPTVSVEAAPASPYPGTPTTNEFSYRGYDENSKQDRKDRDTVHLAFAAWAQVLQKAIESLDNTKDPTFDRWFPSQAGDGSNNARAYVKGVFGQLFEASPTSPAPKSIVAEIVNLARDAGKLCKGSTRAYFGPTTGRFHVCRQGLLQRTLPWEISCEELGDAVSTKMMSLTGTILHEFLHWQIVDEAATLGLSYGERWKMNWRC